MLKLIKLKPYSRPSIKNSFSLTELLVVVAILLILLSMLQPALRRVMSATMTASCLNHQKQLGSAQQIYSGDYNNFIMSRWIIPLGPFNLYWPAFLSGQQDVSPSGGTGCPKKGPVYLDPGSVFGCPANDKFKGYVKHYGKGGFKSEYAYGMYTPGGETSKYPKYDWKFAVTERPNGPSTYPVISTFNLDRVQDSEKLVLLADTTTSPTSARPNSPIATFSSESDWTYGARIHLLHEEKANVLFFDLHVENLGGFDINATNAHPRYFWSQNSTQNIILP